MTVLSEGVTSYDGPVITELKGATGMSTSGGDTVDIFGNNLGVAGGAGTGKQGGVMIESRLPMIDR